MSRNDSPADDPGGVRLPDTSPVPTAGADQALTDVDDSVASPGPVDRAQIGPAPTSFADLARRIRSRTTDIIVIGVLAAVGLSFASAVTRWWRDDPQTMTVAPRLPPAPWESPDGVALQFGDQPWSMHRRQMIGNEEAVTTALTLACRAILEESDPDAALPSPDTAELELLNSLESFAPSAEKPEEWAIYELGGFLPWVVGIRVNMPPISNLDPDAEHQRRLLCWAMGLPQPDGSWVLHTIDRHRGPGGSANFDSDLPLPTGAKPSLRLFDAHGGSLVCFSGSGSHAQWSGELDAAWSRTGWRIGRDWTISANGRSAVFTRTTGEGDLQTAEVVISGTPQTTSVGTIIITTQSAESDEAGEAP